MLSVILLLAGAVSAPAGACFPGPAPGFWDCLLGESTFFDGVDDTIEVTPRDLSDSFVLQARVTPLGQVGGEGGEGGLIYADASLFIWEAAGVLQVELHVDDPAGVISLQGAIPLEAESLIRLEVVEVDGDSVFARLYIDAELFDVNGNLGQLFETSGATFVGSVDGTQKFFHGYIGPLAVPAL